MLGIGIFGEYIMKVFVVDNVHMIKDLEGNYYSPSIYDYNFLKRYLKVFDEVQFIGKVKKVVDLDREKYNLLTGEGVSIIELPWYQGFKQMLKKMPELLKIYKESCQNCDCIIFRVAQMESFFVYILGKRKKQPFAIEVVNDPATFIDMPAIFRICSIVLLKLMAKKARGASYVTEHFLQQKYPVNKKKGSFETFYSSIELKREDIFKEPLFYRGEKEKPFRIAHVSNAINTDIKGHSTLLKAVKKVLDDGYKIETICIGDGTKVEEYQNYCEMHKINDSVHFIGRVSNRGKLLEILRTCNLMVLPTKMEGLPRTIIEAMAVGLPCISTPVAGIPELLERKYLFAPDDWMGFALEIERLMETPLELYNMSVRNLSKSKEFISDNLEERRTWFYNKLREAVLSS